MNVHPIFIGVDVGTGSARAGVFSHTGVLLGGASHPIQMWKPKSDYVEQSSDDIWSACCIAVRNAVAKSGVPVERIAGIGFDATCSLVALDASGLPVSASPTGNDSQNVIVWMDHRAIEETEHINATGHSVLQYVGGAISAEMQTPKLLWLKKNLPDTWRRVAYFFDLPDFLTFRATGDDTRSLCSTVCKWTYVSQSEACQSGWDASYFKTIGLGDLADEGFKRIGTRIRPMGEKVGNGISEKAASELGLIPGTPVGVSIIDAHAGGIGMLGGQLSSDSSCEMDFEHRLALIGGTSSCHMAVSRSARYIPGVWGPYHSAMVPGMWLTEGGQSATGSLIDHIVFSHAAYRSVRESADQQGKTVYQVLNEKIEKMAADEKCADIAELTHEFHVQPDFHGNRSPRADATLRGTISGLTLSATEDDLARHYLATIQAVAYGTRHIIETLNQYGYEIDTLFVCGGGAKNPIFLKEHADITGCSIVLSEEPDAVLLGSAVLGSVASGFYPDIVSAMQAMDKVGRLIEPSRGGVRMYHDRKYRVFHQMHSDFVRYREIMRSE